MGPLEAVALLVLFTFLPPLVFVAGIRNAERFGREPWKRVLAAFAWGAIVAVVVAIVVEELALRRVGIDSSTLVELPYLALSVPVLAVVIAPLVEEAAKGLGLLRFRDRNPEPENGIVYGAAIGMGFAATENLVYVGAAWLLQGTDVAIVTGIFRGLATVSLHGATTALFGWGLWRLRFGPRRSVGLALFPLAFAAAVLIHAVYNTIASLEYAALFAVAFGLTLFFWTRRRVRRVEARGA